MLMFKTGNTHIDDRVIVFTDKIIFMEVLYFNMYTLLNTIQQNILSQLIALWRIEICTIKSTSHSHEDISNFVFYVCNYMLY